MNTWILDTAITLLLSTNAVVSTKWSSSRIVGKPKVGEKRGSGKWVRVESTKTDRLNFARGVAAAYRVFVTRLHPVAGESSD